MYLVPRLRRHPALDRLPGQIGRAYLVGLCALSITAIVTAALWLAAGLAGLPLP